MVDGGADEGIVLDDNDGISGEEVEVAVILSLSLLAALLVVGVEVTILEIEDEVGCI